MVLSVPVIALGATLGTATSILALCGVTCLCRHMHPKKGLLQRDRDRDPDPEKARPGVLQPAQQLFQTFGRRVPRLLRTAEGTHGRKTAQNPAEEVGDDGSPQSASPFTPPASFNIKKSTEPVQPRALLKFPDIYGPRPSVTAPEVINYADYTLRTTEEPAASASPQAPNDSRLKRQVTEELFILPQNGVVEDVCVMETWNPAKAASWNQAPKLHYCLQYDQQKAELFVTCLEAVTSDHDGGCDCYVQGSVANRTGSVEAQTALKKRELHTTWEEGLVLPLAEEELPTATLTLTLRTCDRFSRHSVAGELRLGLDGVSVPLGAAQWGELKTSIKEPSAGAGEVLLSISYLPAANRLLVVLIKAKNLHSNQSKELLGKDVSVKVTLKHQARKLKKKQTKRAKHKINPVWNEMIMFELPDDLLQASSVELEVLGQEEEGQSCVLGHCSLGLHASGSERSHWEEMLKNPRRQIAMWHQLHL
ncbi:synaptotagmin-13 isoform X1 [Myotis myotis]|uniref:synaptotagmin-13 isoform X1 n=2 Tax=Myotis TaxID=9434 RepID=UPI001749D81B|nr:synaptotagmin-13 isoform X1 [Myotis myotis]